MPMAQGRCHDGTERKRTLPISVNAILASMHCVISSLVVTIVNESDNYILRMAIIACRNENGGTGGRYRREPGPGPLDGAQ
jgi:hypothetical protein